MASSPFTIKGLLIGTGLSVLIGVAAPYGLMMDYGQVGFNPSSPAAIFLFFVLTLFVNSFLRLVSRSLALGKADLVLIYAMMLMSLTVPTWGFLFFMVGTIVYPFYRASPENQFAELYHAHIPEWIAPQDPDAIKYLYEGLPSGMPIPWDAWMEPLANWFAVFMAIGLMMICLSTIFHRQWSVNERLTYPMMQLPQRMIEDGGDGILSPFFKERAMWVGFAVPFIPLCLTGLHQFFPTVPEFSFHIGRWDIFRQTVFMDMNFSFAWVGFFYLVNLDVTFSIWFFFLLFKVQSILFHAFGITGDQRRMSAYEGDADVTHQATGAVIIFVLYVVWAARGHIGAVLRRAWHPPSGDGETDSTGEELLSYRVAVLGFVGGLLFLAAWSWRSGVPLIVIPILLFISLVYFIFITRVVTGAGVAVARGPLVPMFFIITGVGTSLLGAKGLVALNFTMVWVGEMRQFAMIACSNALKLAESIRGPKGRLFWALMIALAVTFVTGICTILIMNYKHGALNLGGMWTGVHGWPFLAPYINDMPGPSHRGWFFTGVGGLAQYFLLWAQHRWFWWPLHPIGMVIVGTGFVVRMIWFSAFVAWLLKATILKFWGGKVFQDLKTFFLGMIVGEATVAGLWWVIFWLVGERGRMVSMM